MIKKLFLIIILGIVFVFLPKNANADLGPKPTADIDVIYDQQKIPDLSFNAKMLSCLPEEAVQRDSKYEENIIQELRINTFDAVKKCYWFPARMAWGGQCTNSSCTFGYFLPDQFKLAVFVPSLNKVFITNEISRVNFNSNYRAELFSDGTSKIIETTPIFTSLNIVKFLIAFLITIILELLTSLIFILLYKLTKKILLYVLIVNMVSLPLVWFLFPLLKLSAPTVVIISEIFAVLFEAYFIYIFGRHKISSRQSLALSVINNVISLFVGGLILLLLGLF